MKQVTINIPDTMCDYCFLHSQIYKSTDEAKTVTGAKDQ